MGRKKPISSEIESLILTLYAEGVCPSHIAKRIGLWHRRVRNVLVKHRIVLVNKRRREFTAEERAEIVMMYHTMGLNRIASCKHVGQDRIIEILNEEDIPLRRKGDPPDTLHWKEAARKQYEAMGFTGCAKAYQDKKVHA